MASEYLTYGKGEIWFAPFAPNTTTILSGYRFLGNCPEFNLTHSFEELNHMDSTQGIMEEDFSLITSSTLGASIVTDDLKPENLAAFFLGDASDQATAAESSLVYTINSATPGQMYQVGMSPLNPTGHRALDNVVVTDGGSTTYAVNVDYEIDVDLGLLTILSTGGIAEDSTVEVAYDTRASTRRMVASGIKLAEGALFFKARNPAGRKVNLRMPYVQLRPSGDLSMIGEDWSTMNFDLKALKLGNMAKLYADDEVVVA